jgi:hypothetical protein
MTTPQKGSTNLAFRGCHDVYATWYLRHFLRVAFGAPYLRVFVLTDGFGALERLTAFFTTILVGRHVHTPDQMAQPASLRWPP